LGQLCKEPEIEINFKEDLCIIKGRKGPPIIIRAKNQLYGLANEIMDNSEDYLKDTVNDEMLWHHRLGHIGQNKIKSMIQHKLVHPLPNISLSRNIRVTDCPSCISSKSTRRAFSNERKHRASAKGERIVSDIWGPSSTQSLGGSRYYISFTDEYSHFATIYFMRNRSEAFEKFLLFMKYIQNQFKLTIKYFRFDRAGEYLSQEFKTYLEQHGIISEPTPTDTPELNGKAERLNRTLIESTRTILSDSKLPHFLWAEILQTVVHIYNKTPHSRALHTTPWFQWYNTKPSIILYRRLGCKAFIMKPSAKRSRDGKLAEVTVIGYLTGYDEVNHAWRFYVPNQRVVYTSTHVKFFENIMLGDDKPQLHDASQLTPFRASGGNQQNDDSVNHNTLKEDDDQKSSPNEERNAHDALNKDSSMESEEQEALQNQSEIDHVEQPKLNTTEEKQYYDIDHGNIISENNFEEDFNAKRLRSRKYALISNCVLDLVHNDNICLTTERLVANIAANTPSSDLPSTIYEAFNSPESAEWEKAVKSEWNSLKENNTFELTVLPPGRAALKNKLVFTKKYNADGTLNKYKARLVIKGYGQKEGIDYSQTFAPVVKFTSLRTLLSYAAVNDWEIEQMDFVTAFLNGDLEEQIYMEQPEGLEIKGQEDKVYILKKSLYGLKQAPRQWNKKLTEYLLSYGFKQLISDNGVFVKNTSNEILIVTVYVDDILVMGQSKFEISKFKGEVGKKFKVNDLGPVHYIIGLEIKRDRKNRTLTMSQTKYIKDMLNRFNMKDAKPISTPADPTNIISKDGKSLKECIPYQEAIGSLIYCMVCTRPDIAYIVGVLSRYMAAPKEHHWNCIKRVLRYLKGTIDSKITYGPKRQEILGYSDANYAADIDDRKSTGAYIFTSNNGAVSWVSKKQQTVAKSTTEAEYMALSQAASEALWFRSFLYELGMSNKEPILIYGDNQGALKIAQNPQFHNRTKHIDIVYHFIREKISKGQIKVIFVPTKEMIADILTKAINPRQFKYLLEKAGMSSASGGVEE
jgi:hypothetical protein